MPILMMAIVALASFGAIGVLLFIAETSERHRRDIQTREGLRH